MFCLLALSFLSLTNLFEYLKGGQVEKSKIIWSHRLKIWPPSQIWPPSKWASHASNMAFFAPASQNPSCAGRAVLIRPVHHLRPWFASCPPVILPPGMKRFTSLNLWIFCSSCGRYLAPFFFNPCPLHECFGWPTFMYLSRTTPLPKWQNKVSIQIRQHGIAWAVWGVSTEATVQCLSGSFYCGTWRSPDPWKTWRMLVFEDLVVTHHLHGNTYDFKFR